MNCFLKINKIHLVRDISNYLLGRLLFQCFAGKWYNSSITANFYWVEIFTFILELSYFTSVSLAEKYLKGWNIKENETNQD